MSDSLNNKELVAVGHQFAKALSSDTALIDIAKMLTRLAERLDFTTAALHETQKQRDALAAMQSKVITKALDECTEYLDRDCIMETNGISYEEAAQREVGAMALHDALLRLGVVMPKGNQRDLSYPVNTQVAAYEKIMQQAMPDGWIAVPVEMTPAQMRAIQLKSEAGSYITSNLSGAYSLLAEFWEVALAAAPKRIG